MELLLGPLEIRILGCLIEKEFTTPEYYPLSLNALVNACNQKSNRNPVTEYTETDVEKGAQNLQKAGFLMTLHEAGSRVIKYRHMFGNKLNIGPEETAVLCELMLRGPQTVGELRGHADRMRNFDSLASVETVLQSLSAAGYSTRLPREPGRKESRYAHLLSGPAAAEAAPIRPQEQDYETLQNAVDVLRKDLEALRAEFVDFKRQIGG